jgi:uncharacterized protein
MTLYYTSLYAVPLGLLMIALSVHTIVLRAKSGISLGHGENSELTERIRRHGNFVEFVPLALILLGLAEVAGASPRWLHSVGGLLLVARLIHPSGIQHDNAAVPARIIGAAGTQLSMLLAIALIAWLRLAGGGQ